MKENPSRIKSQPPSMIPTHWAVIMTIVAFCAGAGLSWLILHEEHSTPSQPPLYAIRSPGPMAETSAPISPDVSQMSPADSALTLGNWHYDRKAWQDAIKAYQRAISLGNDNADIRTDLGNALRFSGEAQEALAQYQIARKMDPQHENSLCNMATLYSQVLNESGSAVATWKEYLRLFPNGEKTSMAREYIATQSLKEP